MNIQHKVFGVLALSAVLAASLFGAAKPAAASGLMHPLQTGQKTVIADHDGDRSYSSDNYRDGDRNYDGNRDYNGNRNYDGDRDHQREERRREEIRQAEFRRQQEIRRIEERRYEERLRSRRDFRDGDRHDGHRDRNDDSLQIVIR